MSSIISIPWSIKPHFGARINRAHPMAAGLVFAILPGGGGPFDLVGGLRGGFGTGTPSYGAFYEGVYIGGSAAILYSLQTGLDKITTNGSMFLIGRNQTAASSYGYQIASVDAVNTGLQLFSFGFDNNNRQFPNSLTGRVNGVEYGAGTDVLGANAHLRFHRVGMTFDATNVKFFASGREVSSAATTSTPATDANRSTKCFTNDYQSIGSGNCQNVLALVWNRTLGAEEMATLYRNPYAIFQPIAPKLLYSLNATTAAFMASGKFYSQAVKTAANY